MHSCGSADELPIDNVNLAHVFDGHEYVEVAVEDHIYVSQCGHRGFTLFEWKNHFIDNLDSLVGRWIGRTNYAASLSTVYLQIWNDNDGVWETIDSNNTAGAGVDFILEGSVRVNVWKYYDIANWASFRVYQESSW